MGITKSRFKKKSIKKYRRESFSYNLLQSNTLKVAK